MAASSAVKALQEFLAARDSRRKAAEEAMKREGPDSSFEDNEEQETKILIGAALAENVKEAMKVLEKSNTNKKPGAAKQAKYEVHYQ